jgi:hypothetical protein
MPTRPEDETPKDGPQPIDLGEHYAVEDGILPVLAMSSPVSIRIDITDEFVNLYVGSRDWSWSRGCPDINGCGIALDNPVEEEGTA